MLRSASNIYVKGSSEFDNETVKNHKLIKSFENKKKINKMHCSKRGVFSMDKPVISVGVTVYNLEKYIEKCIRSILNQSFSQFELIIVDDGSTDNSRIICEELAQRDKRIKYIFQENGGVSAARNKALEHFSGRYFLLVDGDDTLHPDMLQRLYNLCIEHNAEIATCRLVSVGGETNMIPENDPKIQVLDNKAAIKRLFNNEFTGFGLCNKLIKREIFENEKFPVNRRFEDAALQYRLLFKANKIIMTNEILYYYLIHEESTTRAKMQSYSTERFDIIINFEESYQFMNDNNLPQEINDLNLADYYRALRSLTIDIFNADENEQKSALKVVNQQIKKWRHELFRNSQISIKEKILLLIWSMFPNITLNVYKARNKLILK